MNQPAIITNGLTKRFGDFIATNAITFEVAQGRSSGSSALTGPAKRPQCACSVGFSNPAVEKPA